MDRLDILKKSELFSDLTTQELRIVEAMAEPRQVTAGSIICKQGRIEENIYLVEEGGVAILLEVGPMSQRQVQAATVFESCGWSAMVEPFVATATVKATEKTRLIAFRGSDLRGLCTSRPEIACKIYRAVARVVAKRLRQAYVQLLGVTGEE